MTSPVVWGATPEDWQAFVKAGIVEDLFPYIASPHVEPKPDWTGDDGKVHSTAWKPKSKMPSMVRNGYGSGIKDWQIKTSTEKDVARYASNPDHGICIVARKLRVLDVDIEDQAEADRVESIIIEHLGLHPTRRRSNSSKFAVAFFMDGEIPKEKVATLHGIVEFLATKQQFFAVGTHPSGVRYEWDGGTPDAFEKITREEFEACWSAIVREVGVERSVTGRIGTELVKARSFKDIDDERVRVLEEGGWVKQIADDGKVFVVCPFEAGHSKVDTDHTATVYFPAGVGGEDEGRFVCAHASCEHRSQSEFQQAMDLIRHEFEVVVLSEREEASEAGIPPFKRNEKTGKILAKLSNVMMALRAPEWFGKNIAVDEFRDGMMVTPYGVNEWVEFTDNDYTRTKLELEELGIDVGTETVKEAVNLRADDNRFDSAIIWLREEVPAWDGVERLARFFPDYWGTEDTPYTRAVGTYLWSAMAGRVLDPGCKVDMVPILSSAEGRSKSEAIAAMVPQREFFIDLDMGGKDDDVARLMRGKLVAELGEMKGMRSREMGALKAFITRRYESWIPKYREFATSFPRRLVFIGTTNETEFLSDHTGLRRWLPLAIHEADIQAIERDREQMWAEARELFLRAGVQYKEAEELARAEHDKFTEVHPWEQVVVNWLEQEADFAEDGLQNKHAMFTTDELLQGAMGIQRAQLNRQHRNNAAELLRGLGFKMTRGSRPGTVQPRPWVWSLQQDAVSTTKAAVHD